MVGEEVSEVSMGKKWNRVIFRIGEDKEQLIVVERNSPSLTPAPIEGKVRARRSNLSRGADNDPDAIRTVYETEDNDIVSASNNSGAKDGPGVKGKKRKRVSKKAFKKAGKRIQWVLKKGCKGLGWCVIKIFNTNTGVYNQDSRTCVC